MSVDLGNVRDMEITAALKENGTIIHAAYVVPAYGFNPRFYSLHSLCQDARLVRNLRKPFNPEYFENRGRKVCKKCARKVKETLPEVAL